MFLWCHVRIEKKKTKKYIYTQRGVSVFIFLLNVKRNIYFNREMHNPPDYELTGYLVFHVIIESLVQD